MHYQEAGTLLKQYLIFEFLSKYMTMLERDLDIKWNNITGLKNSPVKGWGGLSKNVQKMSKISRIELSQLGHNLFNI